MALPTQVTFIAGTLGQGGAERQLYYILRTLRAAGVEVRLLCLTQEEFWERPIIELGVPLTWVGQSPSRVFRLLKILSILRRERPQVLQSQHFFTNLYAAAAARLLGIPEVGAIRNDVISEVGKGVLGRLSLRSPRVLAANSANAIRTATDYGVPASRCFLLPNVVDTQTFQPQSGFRDQTVRIMAVGRLVEQKRHDRFLRLLAGLRAQARCPIRGVLVGTGPMRGELEREASELGLLPDTLEFRGAVADTGKLYGEADIVVLTSDWEGTPNVVLEAMSTGIPVVSTRVGGVADLVQDGESGFLVPPQDENSLMQRALCLVENASLRRKLGACGRSRVEAKHSLDSLASHLEDLYQMRIS